MSKHGHALVACATGGYLFLFDARLAVAGAALAIAGSAPDILEMVVGYGPNGERRSVIPHRTLTHSPYPWIILGLLSAAALVLGAVGIVHFAALATLGVSLGAIVHLALDVFSPSGIPFGNPFGTRHSFGPFTSAGHRYLYRTGTLEEWWILAPCAVALVIAFAVAAHRFSGAPFDARLLLANALNGTWL